MKRERRSNFAHQANGTVWCECGARKAKARYACDRCRYLDGNTVSEFDVIQLIRESSDGLSIVSLAAETGRYASAVYRTLQKLEREGRLTRREDADCAGRGGRPAHVYRLYDSGGVR